MENLYKQKTKRNGEKDNEGLNKNQKNRKKYYFPFEIGSLCHSKGD